jgi:hypothetical protein
MSFRPKLNETIRIDNKDYKFTAHSSVKGVPYAQAGRRSTVYQLQDPQGELYALKVFNLAYRSPYTAEQAGLMAQYQAIPGLEACRRRVVVPGEAPELVIAHPELRYAVLMPWLAGQTWEELKAEDAALTPRQRYTAACALAETLAQMEAQGIAHCNLSPANILVDAGQGEQVVIHLLGLEGMYLPGLGEPEAAVAGEPGYVHPVVEGLNWGAEGDGYAGSLLLAELLSGVSASEKKSFTDQVGETLEREWGSQVRGLYEQALLSPTPADYPPFSAWAAALAKLENRFAPAADVSEPEAGEEAFESVGKTTPASPYGVQPGDEEGEDESRSRSRTRRAGRFWMYLSLLIIVVPIGFAVWKQVSGLPATETAQPPKMDETTQAAISAVTLTAQAQESATAIAAATIQTRQVAAVTATAEMAGSLVSDLQSRNEVLATIPNGELDHVEDDYIELQAVTGDIRDFIVEANFENPYASDSHSWDYGFLFRATGSTEFHLTIRSSNQWLLDYREGVSDTPVGMGNLENLATGDAAHNQIKLAALGDHGYLFVNNHFVTELDLSASTEPGFVYLATGLYSGDEVEGESTYYQDVALYAAEPVKAASATPTNFTTPASGDTFGRISIANHYVDLTYKWLAQYYVFFQNNTNSWPEGNYQISVEKDEDKSSFYCLADDAILDCEVRDTDPSLLRCSSFGFRDATKVWYTNVSTQVTCSLKIRLLEPTFGELYSYDYSYTFKN